MNHDVKLNGPIPVRIVSKPVIFGPVFWLALLIGGLAYEAWAPLDSTDRGRWGGRSGLTLRVDHGTGCQYLVGWLGFGQPVPRLRADGSQVCRSGR